MNSLPTDFLIVVGTPAALEIDFERLSRRMQGPELARDLAIVGMADPCRLLYTFLAAETSLDAYLGTGQLNTDDRPLLSYSTYGATFRSTIAANLIRLLACRTDVAGFVSRGPAPGPMLRYYAASNELLLGHIARFVGATDVALRHYQMSEAILEDRTFQNALRADQPIPPLALR
jgi:hypothetical protein